LICCCSLVEAVQQIVRERAFLKVRREIEGGVGQRGALERFDVRRERCVFRKGRIRASVGTDLRNRRASVGQTVGTGPAPEEIVEAVVLQVDDDQVLERRELGSAGARIGASLRRTAPACVGAGLLRRSAIARVATGIRQSAVTSISGIRRRIHTAVERCIGAHRAIDRRRTVRAAVPRRHGGRVVVPAATRNRARTQQKASSENATDSASQESHLVLRDDLSTFVRIARCVTIS
jgi:hypothetical protein